MGLRGPKPKSAEIESAQGFPGRRKAKTKAATAPAADLQPVQPDSASVPGEIPQPPEWLTKEARAIWVEVWTAADAHVRLKTTDAAALGRYCIDRARYQRLARRDPAATYETLSTAGSKLLADCTSDIMRQQILGKCTIRKPDPDYVEMQRLSVHLTATENLIGLNPRARIDLNARLKNNGTGSQNENPQAPRPADAPATPGLGIGGLKPRPN